MSQITNYIPRLADETVHEVFTRLDRRSFVALSATCTRLNTLSKSLLFPLLTCCSDSSLPQFFFKRHIFIVDAVLRDASVEILHEAENSYSISAPVFDVMPFVEILKTNWIGLGLNTNRPLLLDYILAYNEGMSQLSKAEEIGLGATNLLVNAVKAALNELALQGLVELPTESITMGRLNLHMGLLSNLSIDSTSAVFLSIRQALLVKHAEGFKKLSELYLNVDSAKPYIAEIKEQIKNKLNWEKLQCMSLIEELNNTEKEASPGVFKLAQERLLEGIQLIDVWLGDDQILEAAATDEVDRIGRFYNELLTPIDWENRALRSMALLAIRCPNRGKFSALSTKDYAKSCPMIPAGPLTFPYSTHFLHKNQK